MDGTYFSTLDRNITIVAIPKLHNFETKRKELCFMMKNRKKCEERSGIFKKRKPENGSQKAVFPFKESTVLAYQWGLN
jgi:hypothetical protein